MSLVPVGSSNQVLMTELNLHTNLPGDMSSRHFDIEREYCIHQYTDENVVLRPF